MSNQYQVFFKKVQEQLPDVPTSRDLVRAGLFTNFRALARALKEGELPFEGIRLSRRRTIFMREDVLQWLQGKLGLTQQPKEER